MQKQSPECLLVQGRFDIGDTFAKEAALECEESLKRPFEHMHMVLQQVPSDAVLPKHYALCIVQWHIAIQQWMRRRV